MIWLELLYIVPLIGLFISDSIIYKLGFSLAIVIGIYLRDFFSDLSD